MFSWKKDVGPTMWIEPHVKPLKIGDAQTVLEVALKNKVDIGHTCEGMGSCTTCRVFVLAGEANPRTDIEQERANERGFADDERLACQLKAVKGLTVRLP